MKQFKQPTNGRTQKTNWKKWRIKFKNLSEIGPFLLMFNGFGSNWPTWDKCQKRGAASDPGVAPVAHYLLTVPDIWISNDWTWYSQHEKSSFTTIVAQSLNNQKLRVNWAKDTRFTKNKQTILNLTPHHLYVYLFLVVLAIQKR